MKQLTYLAFLIAVLLAACASAATALPAGEHVLALGQSVASADGSVTITFVEILEDSRCPADAMCVWQGNVKVLIEVSQGTEAQQFTLTLGELLEGDVNSITVGDSTVTLTQVDPYPLASQPADPADYRITINIQ